MYIGIFNDYLGDTPLFKYGAADSSAAKRISELAARGGLGLGLGVAGAGIGGLGGLLAAGGHEVFTSENPFYDKAALKLKGKLDTVGLYEPTRAKLRADGSFIFGRGFKDILNVERLAKLRDVAGIGMAGGGAAGLIAGSRMSAPTVSRKTVAKALALGVPLGALGLAVGGIGGNLAGQALEGPLNYKTFDSLAQDIVEAGKRKGGLKINDDMLKAVKLRGGASGILTGGPTTKMLSGLGAGAGLGAGLGLGGSLASGKFKGDISKTIKAIKAKPSSSALKALALGLPLGAAGVGLGGLAGNLSAHGLEAYLHPETFDELGTKVEKLTESPAKTIKRLAKWKTPLLDAFVPKSYEIGRPTVKALTLGGAGAGGLASLLASARLTRGAVPEPTLVQSTTGSGRDLLKKIISGARLARGRA